MRITEETIRAFAAGLSAGERASATIEKYVREARRFSQWLAEREPDSALARAYKAELERAPAGVNGAVAALNCLFTFLGLTECRLKSVKIQRRIFRDEDKELAQADYFRQSAQQRQHRYQGELGWYRHPRLHRRQLCI